MLFDNNRQHFRGRCSLSLLDMGGILRCSSHFCLSVCAEHDSRNSQCVSTSLTGFSDAIASAREAQQHLIFYLPEHDSHVLQTKPLVDDVLHRTDGGARTVKTARVSLTGLVNGKSFTVERQASKNKWVSQQLACFASAGIA